MSLWVYKVRHDILIRSKVLESKGSCFRLDGTHE